MPLKYFTPVCGHLLYKPNFEMPLLSGMSAKLLKMFARKFRNGSS